MSLLLLSSQLAAVTRTLGRLGLQNHAKRKAFPVVVAASSTQPIAIRSFGSKKSKKKGVHKQQTPPAPVDSEPTAAQQHSEWVEFQRSIAVEGFETGQTTTVQRTTKKSGGGGGKRKTRRDAMHERILERQRLTELRGGEFPPLRYSPEETERLLAQAYAAVPPRAGPRGTRRLKRQKRRWALVREIRRKYKWHLANFQVRRMQERSRKKRDVNSIIREAKSVRRRDREYQLSVLQRWASTMRGREDPLVASEEPTEDIQEAQVVGPSSSQKKMDG